MRYDPDQKLDVEAWLSLNEDERMSLVMDYHRRACIKLPNARLHAAAHTIVENQAALGTGYAVAGTLERLMNEGLDRHDSRHRIGAYGKHPRSAARPSQEGFKPDLHSGTSPA